MKTPISKRLTRKQFLARSLNILAKEGHAKLRVQSLTKELGVTTGSFYWHFKNRWDFVLSLVEYWGETSTTAVLKKLQQLEGSGEERLYALMQILHDGRFSRHDVFIHAWAARDKKVAALVKEVDSQRYEFVKSLFSEIGFRGQELEVRTRIFAVYFSLEFAFLLRETPEERRKRLKLKHAFFTRK